MKAVLDDEIPMRVNANYFSLIIVWLKPDLNLRRGFG